MSNKTATRFIALAIALATAQSSSAQTCGFVGERRVKHFWIENGLGLVVVPTQNFDNAMACTRPTQAIIVQSHPLYKQMHASVMMAMATGTPINGYACECQSAWNQTYPVILNLGVGGTPQ